MSNAQKNVLGEDLELCGSNPMTGYLRDGCCNTDEFDRGSHTVCAVVTDEFLEFSKSQGNDTIKLCCKLEQDLSVLDESEKREFLKEFNL